MVRNFYILPSNFIFYIVKYTINYLILVIYIHLMRNIPNLALLIVLLSNIITHDDNQILTKSIKVKCLLIIKNI